MTELVFTPTEIEISDIYVHPITLKKFIPVMNFDITIPSPFIYQREPLNYDSRYIDSVIDHLYFRLKEKWLYKSSQFKDLLKYFVVTESNGKGRVRVRTNQPLMAPEDYSKYRKYILRYIEKYFLSKKLVKKTLEKYVKRNRVNWFDLVNHSDLLKLVFAKQLKNVIKKVRDNIEYGK